MLVVDRAERGQEGPWRTFARMPTLRSPKEFTGPDLGVPGLTYQAWHEARFGRSHWRKLGLIDRQHWADYLLWVRNATGIAVENETTLRAIGPLPISGPSNKQLFRCELFGASGSRQIYTRRIVLASGQDGAGKWVMPACIENLPPAYRAHAADGIDFAALSGKTVAILGAGASAADNAAVALEARCQGGRHVCSAAKDATHSAVSVDYLQRFLASSGGPGRRVALAFHATCLGHA